MTPQPPHFSNPNHLRATQYKDDCNLNARMALHIEYGINKTRWPHWVFDQLEFPPGGRVLEVGCGPGSLWQENASRISPEIKIVLTDLSAGMVQAARGNLGQSSYEYAQAVAEELPFPNAHFDTVLANHMLYHVPDIFAALKEIRRVLRPDGGFYAATNGEAHMAELTTLIQTFSPNAGYSGLKMSFNLENGAGRLNEHFSQVEMRPYVDGLHITEAEPLADYILSMASLSASISKNRPDLISRIQAILDKHGHIHISKSTGIFIAQ
jgi:ubiquinone/menaquinone biosynthesis C-methylase UbiE